jgi:Acetyltransferase (GNAT) domain
MSSGYSIVPGDPRGNKGDVLGLAERNLRTPPQGRAARYAKYYERNPLGPPSFFLAREARSQDFVGMATLFPTRLRVFGELVGGGISGDFAVDQGHRGFGPSVALQRAVVSALEDRDLSCAYGFPNEFSEPITNRVGYVDLGRLSRFVKVLRGRAVVDSYARSRGLARVAGAVSRVGVDPLLWVLSRERLYRRSGAFRVERPDVFDDRFSDLWETTWRQHTITSERNPDLLNWKYERVGGRDGGGVFTIFSLVGNDDDRVAGYVVYRARDGIRHMVDIVCMPSRPVVDALLAEFVLDARRAGAAAITLLYLGSGNLLTRRLRAFGFLRRAEESGLRVYVPGESALEKDLVQPGNWYFLTGDADV